MGFLSDDPPHANYFLPISHISAAVLNFKQDDAIQTKIKSLGKVFAKHRLTNDFGLILLHQHFGLNEMEIIVETFAENETQSLAVPWKISQGKVASPNLDEPLPNSEIFQEKEYVIPQSWYFTCHGHLQSYEFLSYSEPLPAPPKAFVEEFFQELRALGCSDLFGIRRTSHLRFPVSWEISPKNMRINLTKYGSELPETLHDNKMVTVSWAFSELGDVRPIGNCSSSQSGIPEDCDLIGPLHDHN